ncbi:hypothetical protein BDN72DRAFT_767955, partial [Pluteus cervinus]
FSGDEFAWGDSAYPLSPRMIPIHKEPASLQPENKFFDKKVSTIRVRSEHCMGALKSRFPCLRSLRVNITSVDDHWDACRWITIAIIIHNMVIDVEGSAVEDMGTTNMGSSQVGGDNEGEGDEEEEEVDDSEAGELKRQRLIAELLANYN